MGEVKNALMDHLENIIYFCNQKRKHILCNDYPTWVKQIEDELRHIKELHGDFVPNIETQKVMQYSTNHYVTLNKRINKLKEQFNRQINDRDMAIRKLKQRITVIEQKLYVPYSYTPTISTSPCPRCKEPMSYDNCFNVCPKCVTETMKK